MSDKPIVGITTYATNDEEEFTLPRNYVDSIRAAGGVPFLLPPGEQEMASIFATIDCIVLSGGGDIDPQTYGGSNHEKVYMVDAARDQMEVAMARRVLQSQMPTLAICRGIQVINVALGGTLFAHLPDTFGETVLHRAPPRLPILHDVSLVEDSRLSRIIGSSKISSMSWHHQAIDKLGAGLRVVANASDGVIEAVESADHPNLVAVQWHPEITAATDSTQQALFDHLIDLARKTKN